jgi:glycosyltransferase involved in cell wall biosynthesis
MREACRMTPRILFINHTAVLGGGELSLLDIARHFRGSCRVVLLADGPFRMSLEQAGVQVEILDASAGVARVTRGGGLLHDLVALPGLLRLAKAVANRGQAFDLLYANSQKSMFVAALAGRLAGKPVLWHLRDLLSEDHFSWMHRRVASIVSNLLVHRVVANSEATREAFIGSGGRATKARVVHNGIDAFQFTDVPDAEVARARASLGLTGVPVIGVFSRLAPWKGQHILLEALRSLPSAHALLVGEALFEADKTYVEDLLETVRQTGTVGRVHFLGFRRDIPLLLRVCDVVAHTSVAAEPFGRVIVEGMLARRPVVATRGGGALEIIDDGETGLLVTPGDPVALADTLRSVLERPEQAATMACRGQQAALDRFSLKAMLVGVNREILEAAGQCCGPTQNSARP